MTWDARQTDVIFPAVGDFHGGSSTSTERTLSIKNIGVNTFCKSHGLHVKYQIANAKGPAKPAKKNYQEFAKGQPLLGVQSKDSDLMVAIEELLSLRHDPEDLLGGRTTAFMELVGNSGFEDPDVVILVGGV